MLRVLLRRAGSGAQAPLLLAAIIGLVWTFHLHGTGLRMSGDSALFAHTALVLESTGEWTAPTTRPPLYPYLLAGLMAIEPFAANAAAWLSGLSLTALLMVLSAALHARTKSAWMSAAIVMCAAVWSPLVGVFEVMWTEGPCALLLLLHVALVRSDDGSKDGLRLPIAGAAVGMAATTRFLAIAAALAFVVWLCRRRPRPRDLLCGAIALGIPAAWLLRNRLLHGSATGERRPSTAGWDDNLLLLVENLRDALIAAPVLGIILVLSMAVLAIRRALPGYLTLQIVAQLSAIVVATSLVAVDPIGLRYLAPVLPLLLLYIGDAWRWLQTRPTPHKRTISWIAAAAVTLAAVSATVPMVHQQRAILDDPEPRSSHGRGFVTSVTGAALSQALAAALTDLEEVHILLIDARNSSWQWGSLARHRAIWREAGIEVESIVPDGDHTVHFRAVRDTGAPLLIHLHRGAPFRKAANLRRHLNRIDLDSAPVIAIAHSGDLRRGLGTEDLQDLMGADVEVSHIARPAPYTLASIRSTTPAPAVAPQPTKKTPPIPKRDQLTVFHPQLPPASLSCTSTFPVDGRVRVSAKWKGTGLAKDTVARLVIGLKDAKGTTIAANRAAAFHRAAVLRGNTSWQEVDTVLEVPDARSAKACVKVVGESTQGSVTVAGLSLTDPATAQTTLN